MSRLTIAGAALALTGGTLLAADLPFYKPGSVTPDRSAASTAASAAAVPIDSRTVLTVASPAVPFYSSPRPGLTILVR